MSKPGRPFRISQEDVRLYYDAMYSVVTSMEWPWTERGILQVREPPERDDDLPSAESLQHTIETFLSKEAQQIIKARARKNRHRKKKMPVCVHLEHDAWQALRNYAEKRGVSLSDAVRECVGSKGREKA